MSEAPRRLAAELARIFERDNESWTATHIKLCEIAAPAYGEGPRGEEMAAAMYATGLEQITCDEVGNVYGRYPGGDPAGPRLAVSAHLDTVFGPEVDVTVTREGPILRAPGVCDDTSGLVMLLALAAAFGEHRVALSGDLWLLATVGEESVGNLRGARKIAADGLAGRPLDAFITLDTSVPGQVIRHGTHSSNHDLVLSGPGGHAWGDFGRVSPTIAVARIVAKVSEYDPPASPRTSYNCGVLEGGFAPNAIPERARGHLNLRSEDAAEWQRLDRYARRVIAAEIAAVNRQRKHGAELTLEHQVTLREGGETPLDRPLVRAAAAAVERQGWQATHPVSSTDANAFMARGVDAVCLYCGEGGGQHTLDEWYDAATRPTALTALAETALEYFRLTPK